jgi:glycine/D-amino acid oxidase-like deaminating enzyme
MELWTPAQAKRKLPLLHQAEFDGAAWCGTDGIVDIHALLSGYLKYAAARGAKVRYNCAVRALRRGSQGGFVVVTDTAEIEAKILINAAGAWANPLARLAGAKELPLRPCRRHLFVSGPLSWIDKSWPFVWHVTHDIYFRPEGEGLLLCACDQTELAPGDPPVDESVKELLAEKIERYMPALSEVSISRGWAGFRTLTPDGRFIIGWDPGVENFFWVAGLGGHGMTTSASVGELAAELLLGGPGSRSAPFAPDRFG